MLQPLPAQSQNRIFREARTVNLYSSEPVTDELLASLYDLMKWGPTSTNQQPLRIIWCRTPHAREKLASMCLPGNAEKVRLSPVAAILGMDIDFIEYLPRLFPHADARNWYEGNEALIQESAFRNSSLQAGYLIVAARMLGLDVNPMSGFDAEAVNRFFFKGTNILVNFIMTLGHGNPASCYPRGPRLDFEEACVLA